MAWRRARDGRRRELHGVVRPGGLLALGSAALLAAALLLYALHEPEGARGIAHERIPEMRASGPAPGAALHAWGWAFGLLQIAFFVGLLALGLGRKLAGQGRVLVGCGLAFAGVWSALVWSDLGYAADPSATAWWGLPAPTLWMLIGIWWLPCVFIALYALRFERLVYGETERQRFAELMRRYGPEGERD